MAKILFQSQVPLTAIKKIIHAIVISKIFNVFSVLALLLAIPLTVYVAQQQQETRQRAQSLPITPPSPTSNSIRTAELSIDPARVTLSPFQTKTFKIVLEPGRHQVSFVKVLLAYTNSHLGTSSATPCKKPVCINTRDFPAVFEEPTYTPGFIGFTVSIGASPKKALVKKTTVATITFKTQQPQGINRATIDFVTSNDASQVLSISSRDNPSLNVLRKTTPAQVFFIEKNKGLLQGL